MNCKTPPSFVAGLAKLIPFVGPAVEGVVESIPIVGGGGKQLVDIPISAAVVSAQTENNACMAIDRTFTGSTMGNPWYQPPQQQPAMPYGISGRSAKNARRRY